MSTFVVSLYVLYDERDLVVRYVGKTTKRLGDRLRNHITQAKAGGKTHRDAWIRSLLSRGLRPRIALLERCGDEWPLREQFWIRYYRGVTKLTNHSIGGEKGPLGVKRSAETRAKISAARRGKSNGPHAPETRRKIGDAQRGKPRKPWTPEAKAKASASLRGRRFTEEHRRKIGEANSRRGVSEETRQRIADGVRRYYANKKEGGGS